MPTDVTQSITIADPACTMSTEPHFQSALTHVHRAIAHLSISFLSPVCRSSPNLSFLLLLLKFQHATGTGVHQVVIQSAQCGVLSCCLSCTSARAVSVLAAHSWTQDITHYRFHLMCHQHLDPVAGLHLGARHSSEHSSASCVTQTHHRKHCGRITLLIRFSRCIIKED